MTNQWIPIVVDNFGTTPTRAHHTDAGLDLYTAEDFTLHPGHRHLVTTGVKVQIPEGHVGLICPRSGLAAAHGVTVLNSPGVVDAGYTGEVLVNLINHGDQTVEFEHGLRIAQLLIIKAEFPTPLRVDALGETERGCQGHGSTGA